MENGTGGRESRDWALVVVVALGQLEAAAIRGGLAEWRTRESPRTPREEFRRAEAMELGVMRNW
jgi:hypothetical protein